MREVRRHGARKTGSGGKLADRMPAGRPKGPPTRTHGLRAPSAELDYWTDLAAPGKLTPWLIAAAREKAARESATRSARIKPKSAKNGA